MLLRRWLEETPVFEEMRRRATISREFPLRAVLRGHGRAIAVSVLTTWMLTAAIVVVILMTPTLLQDMFRLTPGAGLYIGAARLPSVLTPLYVLAGIGAGGAVLAPLVMVRAFPPAVRFTGVSFSYNLSYAVFGGVTPLLVSWISHLNQLGPAHYIAAVTILGLVAILTAGTARAVDEG